MKPRIIIFVKIKNPSRFRYKTDFLWFIFEGNNQIILNTDIYNLLPAQRFL